MKRVQLMFGLATLASSIAVAASAPDTEAVEYYNAITKHYFVTATASEARLIDDGAAGEGWMRTGRSFQAWIRKEDAPSTAQPVCRFYSSGANSHFYTAGAAECDGLKAAENVERSRGPVRGWQYEGIAFHIQAPTGGHCPAGTTELVRAYNNGFSNGEGSNHRFIDDPGLVDLMIESRWLPEGAVFCAATKSTGTNANLPPTATRFEALVGTWKGTAKWEVESAGGETESRQPLELALAADGAISGSGFGCAFTGKVTLGDGFRSFFTGSVTASGCSNAAFNGEYLRVKLQRFGADTLMVKMKRGDDASEASIEARLVNDAAPVPATPASFGGIAGEWVGTVGWEAEGRGVEVEANRPLTLIISATGAVTGSGFGCTLTGSLTAPAQVTAAGCDNAAFNGQFNDVRVRPSGSGKLSVRLKREANGVEVEIEGELAARDAGTTQPAPVPPAPASLVGKWDGNGSWTAGGASGSGSVSFTIGADGSLSGSGMGCTIAGTLRLALDGRAVTGGSVTLSGCTRQDLNVTFAEIEFEREDGNALQFELEREVGGVKVKVKGRVVRAAG
jgi:hypothetical protein